jgi:hypothetical protein
MRPGARVLFIATQWSAWKAPGHKYIEAKIGYEAYGICGPEEESNELSIKQILRAHACKAKQVYETNGCGPDRSLCANEDFMRFPGRLDMNIGIYEVCG